MELTAAEQQRLKQLQEIKRLRLIDQARQKGQREYDDSLMVQKLAYGVARPFQQAGFGIKEMFTDLTEEDQLRLEEIVGKRGNIATAGEIIGEGAALAVPAAKLGEFMLGLGKYAPKILAKLTPDFLKRAAPLLKRATPLLADMGLTVGSAALKAKEEGKSKQEDATNAAVGYAATALGLKGLQKGYGALKPSQAGSRFLDAGIPLTPGQASDNPIIQGTEETLASLPFISKPVERLQQRSLERWNTNLLNKANANEIPIEGVGSDAFSQLIKGFDDAYDSAYKSIKPSDVDFKNVSDSLREALKKSGERVSGNFVTPTKNIVKDAGLELSRFKQLGEQAKLNNNPELLEASKEALKNANKILKDANIDDRGAQEIIKELRKKVSLSMGKGGTRLRDIDNKYAKFSILRSAVSDTRDPLQNNLVISPANLTGAMKKSASKNQLAQAEGFLQKESQEATDVFSKTRPGSNLLRKSLAGTGFAGGALLDPITAATSLAATSLATSETGRKLVTNMMKGSEKQAAFAKLLREGAAKKTGLTAEDINRLLYRMGGLKETAGDTESYGN